MSTDTSQAPTTAPIRSPRRLPRGKGPNPYNTPANPANLHINLGCLWQQATNDCGSEVAKQAADDAYA